MPAPAKPGINWTEIRRRYTTSPEPISRIAREHGISRTAIQKKAARHGWGRPGEVGRQDLPVPDTPTVPAIRGRSPETKAAVIGWVKQGVPEEYAGRAVGLSKGEIKAWIDDDFAFARELDMAFAGAIATMVSRINLAGARGDSKADMWLLERLKQAREEFAPRSSGRGDAGLTVNINIGEPIVPPIVEVEAND